MLKIHCPYCGKRDEEEFSYGGPWNKPRPANPLVLTDEEWADYLFTRDNVRGVALERWRHTFGCRQWFVCERDSVTHAISNIYRLNEVPVPATGPSDQLSATVQERASV
ncbi:sarcosine oxidase subunit delta [Pseudomonas monteilii]|uniref:sarcosine oxidase subunit delta n=1 Tax=Pseudomonas monteilii TaxID=76759 RepID=UPI0037FA0072